MKRIIVIMYFFVFSCKTANAKKDYNFTWHSSSYLNDKIFDEYFYDSKTKIYILRESNSVNKGFNEIKTQVQLNENQLKKIYHLYLKLEMSTPNRCIYNKKTGELLEKSVIRFYDDQKKWEDENCNIESENKDFNNLWHEIDRVISSTPEYKKAIPPIIGK